MAVLVNWLLKLFTGGFLDRVLDTVDKRVEAQTDREKIKADLIATHYRTRGDFMRSGGFFLMLLFAVPLAFWFGSVVVYSVLWCAGCAYPQEWTIAALPAPLDRAFEFIVVSIFGVIGVSRFK